MRGQSTDNSHSQRQPNISIFASLIHRLQNGPESGGSSNTDAGWRDKYQRTAEAARISVAVLDVVDQVTLRNLVNREQASFRLPLAKGYFYPDFVAEFNDGRLQNAQKLSFRLKGEILTEG